jgi:hypothetical protein
VIFYDELLIVNIAQQAAPGKMAIAALCWLLVKAFLQLLMHAYQQQSVRHRLRGNSNKDK